MQWRWRGLELWGELEGEKGSERVCLGAHARRVVDVAHGGAAAGLCQSGLTTYQGAGQQKTSCSDEQGARL